MVGIFGWIRKEIETFSNVPYAAKVHRAALTAALEFMACQYPPAAHTLSQYIMQVVLHEIYKLCNVVLASHPSQYF